VPSLNAISLFSGAGGLDYGFEAAGFETHVALEMAEDCVNTLQRNRPWNVIPKDIHNVSSKEILSVAGLRKGAVDVLFGGPPCQPFSKSGYWSSGDSRRLNDERASTISAYMRCVQDTLPKVFLLENVHGIRYSGKEEGFIAIQELVASINKSEGTNYTISWQVLNAADYGVPQVRKRFFLVAQRDGTIFRFPEATHQNAADGNTSTSTPRPDYVSAWDALACIETDETDPTLRVGGKWADLLPSIPEGENYLWHTNRKGGMPLFGWRTRYWNFLLKLAKDKPAWTVQAHPGPATGPFHWNNRRLSARELAAIQTFPQDIVFTGNRYDTQKQVGNAVPSLLAEIIARAIGAQFFGLQFHTPPKLSVPLSRPIPPPEPVLSVPEQYLIHVGDHAEHPGTGKGPLYRTDRNAPGTDAEDTKVTSQMRLDW
jgi:DNA (cytosine-5)-methyltransferase 1